MVGVLSNLNDEGQSEGHFWICHVTATQNRLKRIRVIMAESAADEDMVNQLTLPKPCWGAGMSPS